MTRRVHRGRLGGGRRGDPRGCAPDRPGAADLPRQPGRRRAGQHARLRAGPAPARRTARCRRRSRAVRGAEPFAALPGLDLLVPEAQAYADPDLVIVFDAASRVPARRPGRPAADAAPASVVLDHHASNTGFGGIHLVDADAAATSVVAERLLDRLGVPLDAEIAECLYVALATDTGSFKFDMTTPAGARDGRPAGRHRHQPGRDHPADLRHPAVRRDEAVRRGAGPGARWTRPRRAARAWCGRTRRSTTWSGTGSGRTCWSA